MGLINYSTLTPHLSANLVHNNRANALVFDFHHEFLNDPQHSLTKQHTHKTTDN